MLTGNDLGMLGNVEQLPDEKSVEEFCKSDFVQDAIRKGEEKVHLLAHEFLLKGEINNAWKVLLS